MIHFVSFVRAPGFVCLLRGGGGEGGSHGSETDGHARPSPSRTFALVNPGEIIFEIRKPLLIVIYQRIGRAKNKEKEGDSLRESHMKVKNEVQVGQVIYSCFFRLLAVKNSKQRTQKQRGWPIVGAKG